MPPQKEENATPQLFDPAAFLTNPAASLTPPTTTTTSSSSSSSSAAAASPQKSTTALLILNQPIASLTLLTRLWQHSSYHLCADGGANRLYALLTHSIPSYTRLAQPPFLPSAIHGDLDSLQATPRAWYAAHGVPIVADRDQESTDLGKALRWLETRLPRRSPPRDVLVLGGLGGRVDQGLGLVGELGREARAGCGSRRLWLVSECAVSWVLMPGWSVVRTLGRWGRRGGGGGVEGEFEGGLEDGLEGRLEDGLEDGLEGRSEEGSEGGFERGFEDGLEGRSEDRLEGRFEGRLDDRPEDRTEDRPTDDPDRDRDRDPDPTTTTTTTSQLTLRQHVGIIPAYGRATISTRGLRWDVADWDTEMGGRVSSSNQIVAQQVEVWTDAMVLFTVETGVVVVRGRSGGGGGEWAEEE